MKKQRLLGFILFLSSVVITNASFTQEKRGITVDWIYSDSSSALTALPRFIWLKDSTAIFFDLRQPKAERCNKLMALNTKNLYTIDVTYRA